MVACQVTLRKGHDFPHVYRHENECSSHRDFNVRVSLLVICAEEASLLKKSGIQSALYS
jgi:hypothetical protein